MVRKFAFGALVVAAVLGLSAAPARAVPREWQEWGPAFNRTCSGTGSHAAVYYQVCVEFSATRGSVQASVFVNPGATRYVQADVRLWFGGGHGAVSVSCPTYAMAAGQARRCSTGWVYQRRPYVVADATLGIQGTLLPMVRALDMSLAGRRQEQDNWCGPGAVQTALATLGLTPPSQATLADEMHTDRYSVTLPTLVPWGLNANLPTTNPYRYVLAQYGDSGLPRIYGVDAIRVSLSRGMPVVILVNPSVLPWSRSDARFFRHYLTIVGFGGSAAPDEPTPWAVDAFKVWDPNHGERAISEPDLIDAAANAGIPGNFAIITSVPK